MFFNQLLTNLNTIINIINLLMVECKKNLKLIRGVDFDLIENHPSYATTYLPKFDDLLKFVKIFSAGNHRGLKQDTTKTVCFIEANEKRCRVTKHTRSLFLLNRRLFTNQLFKPATRSRISIEKVVSRYHISSLRTIIY